MNRPYFYNLEVSTWVRSDSASCYYIPETMIKSHRLRQAAGSIHTQEVCRVTAREDYIHLLVWLTIGKEGGNARWGRRRGREEAEEGEGRRPCSPERVHWLFLSLIGLLLTPWWLHFSGVQS